MSVKHLSYKDGILTINLDVLALAFLLAILLHVAVLFIPKMPPKKASGAVAKQEAPFQMQLLPRTKPAAQAELAPKQPPVLTRTVPAQEKPDYSAPPPKPRHKEAPRVASAPVTKPVPDQTPPREIAMGGLDDALNRRASPQPKSGQLLRHLSDLPPQQQNHDDAAPEPDSQIEATNDPVKRFQYGWWFDAIKRKVEHVGQMNFPHDEHDNPMFGRVHFRGSLSADGKTFDIKVLDVDGPAALGPKCKLILERSVPLPPPPKDLLDKNQQYVFVGDYYFVNSSEMTRYNW
ncbi:hypothetical protein [Silvimonas amylolytica]|uniref:Protein TonB, links inner and outer membranes n=1 Tax=Silvimonas amylolytica TaxID=449663 RepID=A0ABQ2PLC4_9NEIS|nr:hypothetical protein [Silvimonas amylolytica]GGP26267.1 hypothetical protein GCM10010971_20860 [Silvimonas amylolytica]